MVSWSVLPLKGKYYGTVVDLGRGKVTVWLPLGEHYAASEREIAEGWEPDDGFDHVETQESYEAARLMASAPDMLEALQRLVDCYSSSHSPETRESCWAQARAAIKKATT